MSDGVADPADRGRAPGLRGELLAAAEDRLHRALRPDQARRDAVDAHLRPPFRRQRAGQMLDAGLGRAVGAEERRRARRRGGRDEHGRTPRLAQQRVAGPHGRERRREVEVELTPEPLEVDLGQRPGRGTADPGHDAVEPAEAVGHRRDRRREILLGAHVAGDREHLGADLLDRRRHLAQRLGRAGVHDDPGAGSGQVLGDAAPDAPRRSRHPDDLAREVEADAHRTMVRCLEWA